MITGVKQNSALDASLMIDSITASHRHCLQLWNGIID